MPAVSNVVLFAGGHHRHDLESVVKEAVADGATVAAADQGVGVALGMVGRVDLVIGDMDSADPDDLEAARRLGAKLRTLEADKDFTDLEAAVSAVVDVGGEFPNGADAAVRRTPQGEALPPRVADLRLFVVGLGPGRLDHTMSGLAVLAGFASAPSTGGARAVSISVHMAASTCWAIPAGDQVQLAGAPGATFSIIPWVDSCCSVAGARWELDHEWLGRFGSRGTSNELSSEPTDVRSTVQFAPAASACVEVHSGGVWLMSSCDVGSDSNAIALGAQGAVSSGLIEGRFRLREPEGRPGGPKAVQDHETRRRSRR